VLLDLAGKVVPFNANRFQVIFPVPGKQHSAADKEQGA
jgi:hypothetical protein